MTNDASHASLSGDVMVCEPLPDDDSFQREWSEASITGYDPNMNAAYLAALELCGETGDELPALLSAAAQKAEAVESLVIGHIHKAMAEACPTCWRDSFFDAPMLLNVHPIVAGIYLRIWSGCMDGAKTIAIGTGNGRTTPWVRTSFWRRLRCAMGVNRRAKKDPTYALGAAAALAFKRGRGEPVSFFGVPWGNVLRRGL